MKTTSFRALLAGLATLGGLLAVAHADPFLQIDISGGKYDPASETTIAAGTKFTLYALQVPNGQGTLNPEKFFLSMALTPSSTPAGNFGSFSFFVDTNANGRWDSGEVSRTVSATSGMTYGVPPLEANLLAAGDPNDLSDHGTFPAYFAEQGFWFNSDLETNHYDTQTSSLAHKTITTVGGGGMYYMPFVFDLSGLDSNKSIHFDLYSETIKSSGDIDVKKFAPFSHDGESGHQVPEGGYTAMLLGLAMLGLGLTRRLLA